MNIVIVCNSIIPAVHYGGTERVVWYLGKELTKLGHRVVFLAKKGSHCNFAEVLHIDETRPVSKQIPEDADFVHLNSAPDGTIKKTYLVTMHGNRNDFAELDVNTVFVSKNHAERFGAGVDSVVYNGLDWDDYAKPDLNNPRNYFHFLGKAAWRVKNVKGAIDIICATQKEKLAVLGGHRLNIKMGFRFTITSRVRFYGMVGGERKLELLQGSRGLIFPVRWHEPFGLALTESLFFGCPVLGAPYGSLPEIVVADVGVLSDRLEVLAQAAENIDIFSRKRCHEYACDNFNSKVMALKYLEKYEKILNGKTLNSVPPKLQQIQPDKFLPFA